MNIRLSSDVFNNILKDIHLNKLYNFKNNENTSLNYKKIPGMIGTK